MEKQGKVILERFEDLTAEHREEIREIVIKAYALAKSRKINHLIKFLESRFAYILNENQNDNQNEKRIEDNS